MLRGRRTFWYAACLGCVAVAGVASGCGDDFESCRASRTCVEAAGSGLGGADDESESGAAGLPESSISGGGIGGADEQGVSAAGGAGEGGVGGASEMPAACTEGYRDWFKSSFSFPDGAVIGTADFPSLPWAKTGSLEIDAGKLTGVGSAVASQGVVIPYANARLRFRARFTSSDQKVTVAFNAANGGSEGVRITLDSAGSLSLSEGKMLVGNTELASLETGVDWFVEATFASAGAEISVARASYGTEKQANIEATLSTAPLKATAKARTSVVEFTSDSGVVPSLDELVVATCGLAAPEYEPRLIDTFERSDSEVLGKAELPADLAWSSSSTSIKIVNGALQTAGDLQVATIPLEVPLAGLRIRATLKPVSTSGQGFWADVHINVTKTSSGASEEGFWVWGDASAFNTGIFPGGGEVNHPVAMPLSEKYYVQMDRDADVAVITVRRQSYDGPIIGAQYAGGLLPNPAPGAFLRLRDEGGSGIRFEDIRVDNYPSP